MGPPYTVANPFEWRKHLDELAPIPEPEGPKVPAPVLSRFLRLQYKQGLITVAGLHTFTGCSIRTAQRMVSDAKKAGALEVYDYDPASQTIYYRLLPWREEAR